MTKFVAYDPKNGEQEGVIQLKFENNPCSGTVDVRITDHKGNYVTAGNVVRIGAAGILRHTSLTTSVDHGLPLNKRGQVKQDKI